MTDVLCVCQDGEEHLVKVVNTGDSIHSLLSILDVLTVSQHKVNDGLSSVNVLSCLWEPRFQPPTSVWHVRMLSRAVA